MKTNFQKGFIVPLLVIIIAILLLGGGTYIYLQNQKKTYAVDNGSQPALAQPSNASISNWQVHNGADFSIQYPQGWSIQNDFEKNGQTSIIFSGKQLTDSFTPNLRLDIYRNGGQFNDIVLAVASHEKDNNEAEVSTSSIMINGLSGTEVEMISKAGGNAPWYNDDMYILFQKGNVEYQLQGSFEKSDSSGAVYFSNFYNSLKITN